MRNLKYYSFFLAMLLAGTAPAYAQDMNEDFEIRGAIKGQYIFEENRDLAQNSDDPLNSQALDARLSLKYSPTDDLSFFVEGRGVASFGDNLSIDPQTGESSSSDDFLQLREYWVHYNDLFAVEDLAIQGGRQRIREPYAIWWNNNFDSIRLRYDSTSFSGFIGAGENQSEYTTDDDDFNEDEQDIARVFAEGSWLLPRENRFDLRALYEHDYSGTRAIGTSFNQDDDDDEDNQLLWVGARLHSDLKPLAGMQDTLFSYRADAIGVFGDADTVSSAAGPGNTRIVTAVDNRDVQAYAFDVEADLAFKNIPLEPVFTLGYAYGSGDDGTGDDNAFRQTGLQGNSSKIAGVSRQVHNYGEALRPELSNLHIVTAGTTLNFFEATDFSVIYHHYQLDEEAGDLRSNRVRVSPTGTDSHLGDGLDIVLNSDLDEEFELQMPYVDGLSLRSSLGLFKAGEAYDAGEDEVVVRGLTEIQLSF